MSQMRSTTEIEVRTSLIEAAGLERSTPPSPGSDVFIVEPDRSSGSIGVKGVSENLILSRAQLLNRYPVYIFYFPDNIGLDKYGMLRDNLKNWGKKAGNNLLVGFWNQADPNYRKVSEMFDIKRTPTIIITGNEEHATAFDPLDNKQWSAIVKIDDPHLLQNFDMITDNLDRIYQSFLRGDVRTAVESAIRDQRKASIWEYFRFITDIIAKLKITIDLFGSGLSIEKSVAESDKE